MNMSVVMVRHKIFGDKIEYNKTYITASVMTYNNIGCQYRCSEKRFAMSMQQVGCECAHARKASIAACQHLATNNIPQNIGCIREKNLDSIMYYREENVKLIVYCIMCCQLVEEPG